MTGATGWAVPLACTAALATLEIFRDQPVLEQNRERAAWLERLAAKPADLRAEFDRRMAGTLPAGYAAASPCCRLAEGKGKSGACLARRQAGHHCESGRNVPSSARLAHSCRG